MAAWLLGVGLYGIVSSRNFVHLIGCLSVVRSATYVLLLAVGYRHGAGPPIFFDHPPCTPAVDGVLQALLLTDIVVAPRSRHCCWRWRCRCTSGAARLIRSD